jgi:hypothetical protein
MQRSTVWRECVKTLIDSLVNAPSAAAREVGKVWQWAFNRLDEHPDDFNLLQDSNPETQVSLVKEFLTACERRARGEAASDQKMVQYAIEKSLPISDAPDPYQISREVADALATFGMFLGHQGHNTIDAPSRFPYTAALFGFHGQVFKDILESKKIPVSQREILQEVAKYVPKGEVQKEYFRRCEAAANIEALFGFSKRLLTATDVYQRGLEFYKASSRVGPAITLTFSNTSGLWNPLERHGTADFIRRYGINQEAHLKFKDGFRSTNFTDGILNPALACRRLYLFNEEDTWEGFRKARSSATKVNVFDQDAKELVEEVCNRIQATSGTLHLVSVKNWGEFPPLALVTRVSSEVLMFSNRGSDLSISHAFWCNLREKGHQKEQIDRRVSTVLKAVGDMATGGLLSVLTSLTPFLESLIGRAEYLANVRDRFVGERIRRLLDEEPARVLSELEYRFGLDLEYITPPMLRAQLSKAIEGAGE